ncbi:TetR/AcrR family transcriptional regulator [Facklamia sp. P12955]|uniref:TetR/AcrR family transcriptional regulator n=1 Tax=unclassified Facklamia TaxID=2622293 RepID=UPI003D184EDE
MTKISISDGNSNQDMRSYILEIASVLISELGIEETTLRKIAEAAGISKGTLYYYYPAKQAIIYELAEKNLEMMTEDLLLFIEESDEEIDAEEILKTLFNKIIYADTRGSLHLYLLSDAITNNQSLAKKFETRYQSWRETIRKSLIKGLKRQGRDYHALSYLILALLDGLIIQQKFATEEIPVNQIVKLLI